MTTAFNYRSLEELKESSELTKDVKRKLQNKTCKELYTHFQNLMKKTKVPLSKELEYTYLFRCAEVFSIIYNSSQFCKFIFRENLLSDMRVVMPRLEKLSSDLTLLYQKERTAGAPVIPPLDLSSSKDISYKSVEVSQPHEIPKPTITPKELVRSVELANKTAIIIDYRDDRSKYISYSNTQLITVINVPTTEIKSGVILSSLRNNLEVGQRGLFNRLNQVDYVVLMENDTPKLVNGEPEKGSLAFLLKTILWDYATTYQPKSKPVFMEGGFKSWQLTYGTYTTVDGSLKKPKDQIDATVNEYRKCRVNVSYPDMDPPKPSRPHESGTLHICELVQKEQICYLFLHTMYTWEHTRAYSCQLRDNFTNGTNGIEATATSTSTTFAGDGSRMETTFSANDSRSNGSNTAYNNSVNGGISRPLISTAVPRPFVSSDKPVSTPSTASSTSSTSTAHVNGTDRVNGNEVDPISADATINGHPERHQPSNTTSTTANGGISAPPAVDRGNKPAEPPRGPPKPLNQNITRPTVVQPSQVAQPPKSALNSFGGASATPVLDRSTKPALIKINDVDKRMLLELYNQMNNTLKDGGKLRGNNRPGYTGLCNMGNTCFMNASLQALFHTPKLREMFTHENFLSRVNARNKLGTAGVITSVFSALMDAVWSGKYEYLRPERFLRLFADQVTPSLADGRQHDASEFQLFLLDALHEDTNEVVERQPFEQNYHGGDLILKEADDFHMKNIKFSYSPIHRVFNLQTVSELRCMHCGERSATFEECSLITVELPTGRSRVDLQQCLTSHFTETDLDGDSKWNCPRCRLARRARRSTRIWRLPQVLVIHLKRFSMVCGDYEKNTVAVDTAIDGLDAVPYLHGSCKRRSSEMYRLYAVTQHRGRLNSGHYTALVRHGGRGEWLRCDDESISAVGSQPYDATEAYILFYERV